MEIYADADFNKTVGRWKGRVFDKAGPEKGTTEINDSTDVQHTKKACTSDEEEHYSNHGKGDINSSQTGYF